MKDDTDAVALIESARAAMAEFYKRNKAHAMTLVSVKKQTPEYTVDQDKAPETSWDSNAFKARKSESEGLIAILDMIIEDLQREMKVAKADDAKAQEQYKQEDAVMKETLDKQRALLLGKERELSDLRGEKLDTEGHLAAKTADHE